MTRQDLWDVTEAMSSSAPPPGGGASPSQRAEGCWASSSIGLRYRQLRIMLLDVRVATRARVWHDALLLSPEKGEQGLQATSRWFTPGARQRV
jgi:hypothetical protein